MGGWGPSVGVEVELVDVRGRRATGAAGGHGWYCSLSL